MKGGGSRAERYINSGSELPLPEIDGNDYILELLTQVGYGKSGAMGVIPIDWVDIKAFIDCSELNLNGYETRKLRELSKVYVSQLNASKEDSTPPPFANANTGSHLFANLRAKKKLEKTNPA